MSKENKGLGRGLSALIGMNEIEISEEKTEKAEAIEEKKEEKHDVSETPCLIEISKIDPNYEQPRKFFDENALKELSESIKVHGVIQPLILNKMGSRYMIIAGERRYRASKLAGLTEVPAIIREYTPQQVREISLIENLQREDLNPIEAARAIKALMEEFGLTQDETAKRIGKNRSTVANILRLLSLNDAVIMMVESGRISAGHARTLAGLEDEELQLKLALKCEAEGLSVRALEQLIRDLLNPQEKEKKPKLPQNVELRTLILDMQRVFATKVSAASNGEKGRIYIDFYSKDDLDRIVELVNKWISDNM